MKLKDDQELPDATSKERPSDEAGKIVDKLEDQIKDSQDEFAETALKRWQRFKERLKSDDPETKSRRSCLNVY